MIRTALVLGAAALGALMLAPSLTASAESARLTPPPALSLPAGGPSETAFFAGGCFWGVEGVFEHVKGVTSAVAGYAGPKRGTSYEQVSSGTTGNAETVKVTFDPRVVSYAQLLRIYFSVVADPTSLNRQGPDSGTQYRTALFPTSPAQARQARAYIAQLKAARAFPRPIVTSIEQGAFTRAETYHQGYMRAHPDAPYIAINDRPKVEALKRLFPALYRA
ncbi:peptide-methionine (S)-S-oxide reductase MsrA [Sphingomonas sp. ASV193]|uniref:peptide-methionine (S)-S-oxide reductase MsrA n=1 Tax=Sphingomonas sp. ASV193 TaxID=3144405 RepID=UPI0032E8CF56